MNISIYTCHHKLSKFLSSKYIYPIHVGKELNLTDIGCIGDNTGDNISYKNQYYCELTAQYWIWKNKPVTDYIGMMHYRRHLNFSENQNMPEDAWGVVNFEYLNDEYEQKCGLTDKNIENIFQSGVDIILPKKWDISITGNSTNYDQYKNGKFLHINDYNKCIEVLLNLYPEYEDAVDQFNNDKKGYFTNIFIMKTPLFMNYSEWLFSILFNFEKEINFVNYNSEEKRVIGHIAERLFNIYFIKNKAKFSIKELQRTFIKNEKVKPFALEPLWREKSEYCPIVISFDDNYSISGGVLIQSICENSDISKFYEINILDSGISVENKKRILQIIKKFSNFKIRFFNINIFDELKDCYTRGHFTSATYARLFIPKLFEKYNKILFIDADTIVEHDISELFTYDLGNHLVAGVRDIVMEGFYFFKSTSSSSLGILSTPDYLEKALGIKDDNSYMQAGIILFNIEQMNIEATYEKFINTAKEMKYWFLDQDILNKVLHKKILYLPLEWNVYHGNGNTNDFFPNLKASTYFDFLAARKNPKMIHFAGENKPWNTPFVDFSDNFLKYAYKTPWFEAILINRAQHFKKSEVEHIEIPTLSGLKALKWKLINKFFPYNTIQRNILKKIYFYLMKIKHKLN